MAKTKTTPGPKRGTTSKGPRRDYHFKLSSEVQEGQVMSQADAFERAAARSGGINAFVNELIANSLVNTSSQEGETKKMAFTQYPKERLERSLASTGIAEAYHDGYTASVVDNTEEREGYQLSIRLGGMPPFFSKRCSSLDKVAAEMTTSSFPQGVEWTSVETE
jgi:hypothetical protein